MNCVFAVVYQLGLEHGHKRLLGIYAKEEWAIEAKNNFKLRNSGILNANYYIKKIPLNEEIDIEFATW